MGPERIDDGDINGLWGREEFVKFEEGGTYVEERGFEGGFEPFFKPLRVGREYILRHLGGEWEWWTRDSVEEVMEYAGERGGLGLGRVEHIVFEGAGEVRFRVVE